MRRPAKTKILKSRPNEKSSLWINVKDGIAKFEAFIDGERRPADGQDWKVVKSLESRCSIKGPELVKSGETITIRAIPQFGFKFVSWEDGSTDNPRTVTVTKDLYLKPLVEEEENPIEIEFDGETQKMYYVEDESLIPTTAADILTIPTYYTAEDCPIKNNKIKWFSFYNSSNDPTVSYVRVRGGSNLVSFKRSFAQQNGMGIANVNLSLLSTKNIKSFHVGFQNLQHVNSLGDWSQWKTIYNNGSLKAVFNKCYLLKNLDLSSFDVSDVTNISTMFQYCKNVFFIKGIDKWNLSNNTDLSYVFNKCYKLQKVDVTNWDVSKVVNFVSLFSHCRSLVSVGDLSNWNTSLATSMGSMFGGCYNLTDIGNISNWDVSKVTAFDGVFGDCYSLKKLDLSNWIVNASGNIWMFAVILNSSDPSWVREVREGQLTTLILGQGYFSGSNSTAFHFGENSTVLDNWSRESMMESLYTNQIGRDVTNVKSIYLNAKARARLSDEDVEKIASVGLNIIDSN